MTRFAQILLLSGLTLAAAPAAAQFRDAAPVAPAGSAPTQYADFAAEALPRLEAPFTDFYRAYDAYRLAYAAWQRGDTTIQVASAAPAPRTLSALVP